MERQGTLRVAAGIGGLALCIAGLAMHAPAAAKPPKSAPNGTITVTGILQPTPPSLFGTVALPIRLSRYADGWYRSRIDATRHPAMQRLVAPARALPKEQQIEYVQSAVHRRIRWMSDATEWGEHDYWASAAETLEHSAGDMEDRAIVKLQALKALGFPGRDLYLTMGRDKVGGPIIVLVARLGSRHFVLDDTGGQPYLAASRDEFDPWLSFGSNEVWIHGRRVAKGAGASTAASAASTAASPD